MKNEFQIERLLDLVLEKLELPRLVPIDQKRGEL